jgi:hypothetical protein
MTPVAGGVTDGEEHGLVFGPRALESLRAPRVPIDRIVTVLEEIWARLSGEAIGVLVLGHGKSWSVRPA